MAAGGRLFNGAPGAATRAPTILRSGASASVTTATGNGVKASNAGKVGLCTTANDYTEPLQESGVQTGVSPHPGQRRTWGEPPGVAGYAPLGAKHAFGS